MKRVGVTAASAAFFLLGASPVIADNHEEDSDDGIIPIEIFACGFEDGKGPDDLAAVTAKWNEWMDAEGATDYFAAVMYPNYSSNLEFDVAWIGGWRDGNAMGAGTDMWIGSDSELADEFDAVLDCPAHIMFASMRMKAPEENDDEEDNKFVLGFSNCSIKEGKTFEDVQAAQEVWNAYAEENGFKGGSWVLWPIWGEDAEADYDFKSVGSWPDYATLGANYQLMADGHWRKNNEIWEGLLDCDSSRIYSTYGVRQMADEDE
jgi:hypothetical protein